MYWSGFPGTVGLPPDVPRSPRIRSLDVAVVIDASGPPSPEFVPCPELVPGAPVSNGCAVLAPATAKTSAEASVSVPLQLITIEALDRVLEVVALYSSTNVAP